MVSGLISLIAAVYLCINIHLGPDFLLFKRKSKAATHCRNKRIDQNLTAGPFDRSSEATIS